MGAVLPVCGNRYPLVEANVVAEIVADRRIWQWALVLEVDGDRAVDAVSVEEDRPAIGQPAFTHPSRRRW
jgi:hypothetical protein